MADVTVEVGTQFSFADHAGDFAPAAANSLEQGTPTDVDLTLANIADDAARESDKFDLGANRAPRYALKAALEWFSAPTTGETVDFYIGWSPDSTAANGNPGNLTGTDAAYTGSPATLDEGLSQLTFIGSMHVTADAVVQIGPSIVFEALERYGILVVVNRSGAALAATDDVETHVVMTSIIDDVA